MSTSNVSYIKIEAQQFLSALYGPEPPGWLAIWTGQNKLTTWHKTRNISEIAASCEKYALSHDVYFGVGLHVQELSCQQRGNVDGIIAIPGLWVDLDIFGGTHTAKNLPTANEAVDFIAEFTLPPSILVNSGGGIHAYWLFMNLWEFKDESAKKQAIDLVRRFQLVFIALANSRGWKLDNTSDLTRLLRVPGTFNHKSGNPAQVKTLELNSDRRYGYNQVVEAVDKLAAKVPEREKRDATKQKLIHDNDLPCGIDILDRCAFLQHCKDDAATLTEPEWYAMTTIVARTNGGSELCHQLSMTYPQYNKGETDRKINHALEDTGPFTCQKIRQDFGTWCINCPEEVTSPIVLGSTEHWELPIPFHEYELPPFPVYVLPNWLREYVDAEAISTQTPPDLAGMLVLAICAASVAKKIIVLVKEGWIEPVNLWVVVAIVPGNRKSAVFAYITDPLEEFERAEKVRMTPEIEDSKNRCKILEQTLQQVQNQAAKSKGDQRENLEVEASDLARKLAVTSVPAHPEILADDCSPEAVAQLLAEQGGRIAIMSPEGDIFDILGGRYGNGGVNIGNFLKGHAGDNIKVKRIGRPPVFVNKPAITMGLAVQPDVLRGLIEKPGFRGRGLLGRFLYGLPKSYMGHRKINPPAMPSTVKTAYHTNIKTLLEYPWNVSEAGEQSSYALRFSLEAQKVFDCFQAWLEPQLAPYGSLSNMTDWAGKLAGAVARIAGVLHMAQNVGLPQPWTVPVESLTVQRAVSLAEYLIPHARAAYAEMGADSTTDAARSILNWILDKSLEIFTRRDLFNDIRGQVRFRQVKDLEPALVLLKEHEYIREIPIGNSGRGRPPGPIYRVNPYAQNPQNEHKKN